MSCETKLNKGDSFYAVKYKTSTPDWVRCFLLCDDCGKNALKRFAGGEKSGILKEIPKIQKGKRTGDFFTDDLRCGNSLTTSLEDFSIF